MKIYKVLPDLSKSRHMKLWHRALRSQWSAADLAWDRPLAVRSPRLKDQLGRILSPVLMGEQAALYSVSGLIPVLGQRSEVESQLYLTTWAVDEGRHTELFTRFYGRLDREPMSIRRFPSGYLFQSRIVSEDPGEWLSGVLVSEVVAKKLMEEFRRLDIDPILSEIADGILVDEARHLGFNHIYLEDRFRELYLASEDDANAYEAQLQDRLRWVGEALRPALEALRSDLDGIGIEARQVEEAVLGEAAQRLEASVSAGKRLALEAADRGAAQRSSATAATSTAD